MSIIRDVIVDGMLVGVGVPVLGKGHEIATATKKAHGSMLKWDGQIVRDCLVRNARMTITTGVIAGVVFAAGAWATRVMSSRSVDAQNVSSVR